MNVKLLVVALGDDCSGLCGRDVLRPDVVVLRCRSLFACKRGERHKTGEGALQSLYRDLLHTFGIRHKAGKGALLSLAKQLLGVIVEICGGDALYGLLHKLVFKFYAGKRLAVQEGVESPSYVDIVWKVCPVVVECLQIAHILFPKAIHICIGEALGQNLFYCGVQEGGR